ncbi:MAG: pitrilysin family protein [Acidobacteria bacterium]|nr:pitrilysin family protein [Acidobacteriota bacterium]
MSNRMLSMLLLAGASLWAQAPAAAPAKPAAAAATPSVKTLKFAPLKPVKIPEVTQFTLPNGLRVYLLESHSLPVVSGFALVKTGNLFDPQNKAGLADMVGTVMRSGGTRMRTGDQLNEQLENIAASVETGIGETSGRVSFNALKENTDEVLAVFKDVMLNPEFRQDKLDLAKTQEKSGIARRNDDAAGITGREFSNILYGRNTPYGWNIEYETIDRISRADLVAFHQRYFFPKNTMLAVYGDFQLPEMRAKIEKMFGDWTSNQPPVPEFPKVEMAPKPGVFLAVKEDVNQTNFRIGHLGGVIRDKDFPALDLMGAVLGGSPFTSRLGKAIRVNKGYAYQVGADWGAQFDHPGLFSISAGTKSENTVPAIRTIQAEITKFLAAPPTAEELQSAKDKILNTFVFSFDSPSKTLGRLMTYEYYGYPKDFIFQYQKAVEAVTPADVHRVAKQYLKPENFTYVVTGKPADFKEPLSDLKLPITEIDLKIPEPKKPAAAADAASLNKGAALLNKVRTAMGGAKLAAISDSTIVLEVKLLQGGGMTGAKQTTQRLAWGGMRQENVLPFGKVVSFWDGQSGGWLKHPQGELPLQGPMLQQAQGEGFRQLLYLLRERPGITANYLAAGVLEISDGRGNSTKLVVDEATGVPVKQISGQVAMGGPPTEVEERYLSFQEVDGVKVPSSTEIWQGTNKMVETKLVEAKFNTGLKPEQLAAKP